ncbi:hypothetical protein IPN35_05230 [Candidatus Peregrinibacteria bacterium]|nr:MAG: hypothetical protein IPN35_05230 [Candidatus Peregrinibacteria bacterium]
MPLFLKNERIRYGYKDSLFPKNKKYENISHARRLSYPQENILAILKSEMSEIFREGKLDPKALRQTLGEEVVISEEEEYYGLNWAGKSECFRKIQETTTNTLIPAPEESVNFDEEERQSSLGFSNEEGKSIRRLFLMRKQRVWFL